MGPRRARKVVLHKNCGGRVRLGEDCGCERYPVIHAHAFCERCGKEILGDLEIEEVAHGGDPGRGERGDPSR